MARAKKTETTNPTNPTNKQVITMPEAGTVIPVRKAAPLSNPASIELEDQIRHRAYELYEERGRTPGFEREDWIRAEHEVLARRTRSQSA
ncbi:MAG TPA: DUF2934 domain-containing protein [Terriglobales bacterium]|jgi:hypothetical protein|nr:DUF2934 domain-containing protein [Terriglobales bacterium]